MNRMRDGMRNDRMNKLPDYWLPNESEKKRQKWFNEGMQYLIDNFLIKSLSYDGVYTSTHHHMHAMGMISINGKRERIWNHWVKSGYVVVMKKGFGNQHGHKELSEIKLSDKFIKLAYQRIQEGTMISPITETGTEQKYYTVKINEESLNNYIHKCDLDSAEAGGNLKETIERNKQIAIAIKLSTEDGIWKMPITESIWPRMTLKGRNIHNIPKIVRTAVIGSHYEYDLATAAPSIKLSMIHDILEDDNNERPDLIIDEHFESTQQYVKNKNIIRNRLAKLFNNTYNPEKVVKEALNAIGFGASAKSEGWWGQAINKIIRNQEDRERFLNDDWVDRYLREQQVITDMVISILDPEELKSHPEFTNGKNQIKPNSVMAWLYQNKESEAMTMVLNIIEKYCPEAEVITTVHDAVYTRKPLPKTVVGDIKSELSAKWKYLKLDYNRWEDSNDMKKTLGFEDKDTSVDDEIYEHNQRIRREERLSRGYDAQHVQRDNIVVESVIRQKQEDMLNQLWAIQEEI